MNQVSIGSDNGLSPIPPQAIIWTDAGLLSIRPLETVFSEILTKNTKLFIHENASVNVVREEAAILSRGRWDECDDTYMERKRFSCLIFIDEVNCIDCIMSSSIQPGHRNSEILTFMLKPWRGNAFYITDHLLRGVHPLPMDCPYKWLVMQSFGVFCDVSLNKSLNKQLSCRCCEWEKKFITCFSTGASVATVLSQRPCISNCLWISNYNMFFCDICSHPCPDFNGGLAM